MELGKYNSLAIVRKVDFGVYVDGGEGAEILVPAKYLSGDEQIGDEIEVFVYRDSEDRLVATTETPVAKVGELAYMTVKQVNDVGAFMDWGVQKDLLVPYSEQRNRLRTGGKYLVYVYVDNVTQRIAGTTKVEKYVGNLFPKYWRGTKVDCIFYKQTEIGYRVIVDNAHYGILYYDEVHGEIPEDCHFTAFVKCVREDGKIDLTMSDRADRRISVLAERIYQNIKLNGGKISITDKTEPEIIAATFSCSKKDFKKAIGALYKRHKIVINDDSISLTGKK